MKRIASGLKIGYNPLRPRLISFIPTASFDVGVGLTYGGLGRKVLLSIYSRGGYLGLRTRIMLGDLRGL